MKQLFLLIGAFFVRQAFSQTGHEEIHVARYKGDKDCAVSYTFDDGLAEPNKGKKDLPWRGRMENSCSTSIRTEEK